MLSPEVSTFRCLLLLYIRLSFLALFQIVLQPGWYCRANLVAAELLRTFGAPLRRSCGSDAFTCTDSTTAGMSPDMTLWHVDESLAGKNM